MTDVIVHAAENDPPRILGLYAEARAFMAQAGNPGQWGRTGYPKAELLRDDIAKARLFAVRRGGETVGAFVLVFGEDPTYTVIENGAWPGDKPYGTIHRLCSATAEYGVAASVIAYCEEECRKRGADLRADTHAANKPMRHVLEKAGFKYCGVIHVADGSPRMAYQKEL